jgi:nanoRNase/pAp phosphatase (c-di-AMP/oligoRNAs hydrolase)
MHDNPDPDAIASGWGVQILIQEKLEIPVRLVGGGAIVRAENRHMVDLLAPPIELVSHVDFDAGTAAVLVDCGADATNHVVTRQQIKPVAIIDHHTNGNRPHVSYVDIRPDAAASATIVAGYLREQGIELGPKLATAMLYAVRTETCGHETHFSQLDRSVLPWLTEHGEPALLAQIENAPLTRDYFADLLLALQSTFLYDDAAICFLPRAAGAEIVGEVADMLIRCEQIRRVLCATILGGDLLISARTQPDHGNATKLLLTTLDGIGGAGGHSHRAGGKISGVGDTTRAIEALHDDLRSRWLATCGVERKRGTRLIAKKEIVENLVR